MITPQQEIIWLAGLLEGEACFDLMKCNTKSSSSGKTYRTPRISVTMTDLDVIEHVARLFGGRITALKFQKGNSRPLFQTGIYGEKARWVLNQVLPYMGERRSEKIAELLEHKPAYNRKLKTWPFYEEYCGEIFGVEPSW